jgi:AraC-like DNA-binding protein
MDLNTLSSQEMEFLIDSYIHNEIHRKILKRRMLDHVKFEDLSEEFHYSVRHTKRIVYKAQDTLYARIESIEKSVGSFILQTER